MPVDLSRIMVTDSMLQLLLVRYACIWQTNWGIERASGGGELAAELRTQRVRGRRDSRRTL